MIIDFSNPWAFIVWYVITVGVLLASYIFKKAKLCLIPTFYFILFLGLSNSWKDSFLSIVAHRNFCFIGLATSLSMLLLIDEIETRRKVISKVFKNRYKKNKNVDDYEDNEEAEGSLDEE